jgi:hypothetical protein
LPPLEADRAPRGTGVLLLAPAGVAFVFVWLATAPYGPGLSPDSAQFLAAAKSLAGGLGWRRVEGTAFVEWAPLLPAWLALGIRLGVPPLALARLTGALAATGVAWAAGLWTARSTGSPTAGVGAALVTATALPLIYVASYLWSDTPFLCLALLGVLALGDARARPGWRPVIVAASYAALACLMRYLGVTLVCAGAFHLAFACKRPRHALAYALLSGAPLVAWLARNALVTGTAAGWREPPGYTWSENLLGLAHGAVDPLVRWNWPGTIKLVLVGGAALVAWLVIRRAPRARAGPLALFVALYALAVAVVCSLWGADRVDTRFALPVSVALVEGAFLAGALAKSRAARVGFLLLAALWLGRATVRDVRTVALYRESGVPGFGDRKWRASPTLAKLRSDPPAAPLYSNAPEIAWLALERPVRLSPRAHLFYSPSARVDDLDPFVAEIRRDARATLIWFPEANRGALVARDSLARRVTLRPIAELADGTIDEVSP